MSWDIYVITHIATGMKYVGISRVGMGRRWQGHASRARIGVPGLLYDAIRAFGEEAFTLQKLRTTICREKAEMLERRYIVDLNCIYPGGFNSREGGLGGFTITETTRKKLRDSHLGQHQSQETRSRRGDALRGRKRDPDMIERSAAKRRGAKRSMEFREACRLRALRQHGRIQ